MNNDLYNTDSNYEYLMTFKARCEKRLKNYKNVLQIYLKLAEKYPKNYKYKVKISKYLAKRNKQRDALKILEDTKTINNFQVNLNKSVLNQSIGRSELSVISEEDE